MTAPLSQPRSAPVPLERPETHPNPYVGPRAFSAGETLFGRADETEALISLLLAERIVLVHSQSGAGKTSLLQANLIPRLIAEGFDVLQPARVSHVPADPVTEGHCRYSLSTVIDWERGRQDPRSPAELVHLELEQYLASRSRARRDAPEVLIFDAFEEVLTLDATDLDAKREFCRQAGIVLKNRMRWAIIAMREEYIGALDPFLELFPTRLASRYRLELLSPESARDAIAGPAESVGVEFAPKAVDRLISHLRKVRQQVNRTTGPIERDGPYIEPVQLQVVCTRVWEKRRDEMTVTVDDVGDVGNVDEALGDYYARAVARAAAEGSCDEPDVRDWIETALIVNRVRAQALEGSELSHNVTAKAVDVLEQVYVVRREERRGSIWYELAHDRLVTPVLEDNARRREESTSELEKLVTRWIAEDYVSQVMSGLDVGDRILAAQALDRLVTPAGTTIEYPLLSLDTQEAAAERDRVDFVVQHLVDSRLVSVVGDNRHRLVHDRLVLPVVAWLRSFHSSEAYRGFARVFYQARQILEHAERELYWVNFVLGFGEPHAVDGKITEEYRKYAKRIFRDDVTAFFQTLLSKAERLQKVRILTLDEQGATEFLRGLRSWQEQAREAGEPTAETLSVDAQLAIIRQARERMYNALASSHAAQPELGSSIRKFAETTSLPIQLIIADQDATSGKQCCLAFMVGSEAYRLGQKNEGVVGAHYSEDPAVVGMYRNLAEVLMSQAGVRQVWPPPPNGNEHSKIGRLVARMVRRVRGARRPI
jgi:conflict system STAND superfamily ATPase